MSAEITAQAFAPTVARAACAGHTVRAESAGGRGMGSKDHLRAPVRTSRSPDTVRAPDVAFICSARLPDPPPPGFAELAPDLAVEVLSPDDRPGEVLEKVADWLKGGCRLVWVVDPRRKLARVYRADGTEALVTSSDSLDGEDVLPGFSCELAGIVDE